MSRFGLAAWTHNIAALAGPQDAQARVDRWEKAGYDIVMPCVKNTHGAVDFQTDLADVNPAYPHWDPLKALADGCRSRGIKMHVWFCVFPEGEGSRLLREHPEFAAVSPAEPKHRWACACRQEVQDYVFNLYRDVAERYRPDGLHLDYIRTGTICQCAFCKEQMQQRGVDIETVQRRDGDYETWVDWRISRVTEFVSRLHDFTTGAALELSAAVFSGYPDCRRTQGQDWIEWAEAGLVDFLFPMNYTNSTRHAAARSVCHVAMVAGRAPVWEGLGKRSSSSQLTTAALRQQVEGALQAGAGGIVLFSDSAVTDEDVRMIREARGGQPRREAT